MHRRPSPLAVAAVSGLLLVTVLAVDSSMNRTYRLEVESENGWVTVMESSSASGPFGPRAVYSRAPVTVADNSSVSFRLVAENGYLWTWTGPWEARSEGRLLAGGALDVPGRGTATSEFTVDFTARPMPGPYPERVPFDTLYLELSVDGDYTFSDVLVQEAEA